MSQTEPSASDADLRREVVEELRFLLKFEGLTIERVRRKSEKLASLTSVRAHMRQSGEHDAEVAVKETIECSVHNHIQDPGEQLLLAVLFNLSGIEAATLEKRMDAFSEQLEERGRALQRSALHQRMSAATVGLGDILVGLSVDPCDDPGGGDPGGDWPAGGREIEAQARKVAEEVRNYLLLLARPMPDGRRARLSKRVMELLPELNRRLRPEVSFPSRIEAALFLEYRATPGPAAWIEMWDLLSGSPDSPNQDELLYGGRRYGRTQSEVRAILARTQEITDDEMFQLLHVRLPRGAEFLADRFVNADLATAQDPTGRGSMFLRGWSALIEEHIEPGSAYEHYFMDPTSARAER